MIATFQAIPILVEINGMERWIVVIQSNFTKPL